MSPHVVFVMDVVNRLLQPKHQLRPFMLDLMGIAGQDRVNHSTRNEADSGFQGFQEVVGNEEPGNQNRNAAHEIIPKLSQDPLPPAVAMVFGVFSEEQEPGMHEPMD